MANEQNLKPAKKGEVRNPKGRPKGSSVVAELKKLLNTRVKLQKTGKTAVQAKALAICILEKALEDPNGRACQMIMDKVESVLSDSNKNADAGLDIQITFGDDKKSAKKTN